MKILAVLILALGIILSTSCEKQDLPDAPGTRLKMMKLTGTDNSFFFTNYKYDSKNRLIAEEDSGINGILFKNYFEYDDQDRLVKFTEHNTDDSGNVWQIFLRTFIYDERGKIIRATQTMPMSPLAPAGYNSYGYDSRGRLIADTSFHDNILLDIGSYDKFIYDDQDNLIRIEGYHADNTLSRTRQMKYGTSVNNSYHLGPYYFFATYDMRVLSRNNITEEIEIGVKVTNYEYEFFNNGLPKIIRMRENQSQEFLNMDLYYE